MNSTTTLIDDCWNRIGVWGNSECDKLSAAVHCRNCPVYSNAASQLLDRPLPDTYLREWAGHFAERKDVGTAKTESCTIFRIASEWLALPSRTLQEIAGKRPVHSLPHRRGGTVLGLVNVRGQLVICVSLAEVLGIDRSIQPPRAKGQGLPERLFVTQHEGNRLVFPVDEVFGVHHHNPADLKPPPATISKSTAAYTKGILEWQGKTVGCLDEQLLFYTLNRHLS